MFIYWNKSMFLNQLDFLTTTDLSDVKYMPEG